MIVKAHKYRIYPNRTQQAMLAKTFGCVRFYWNNLVASFYSYNKETNPKPEFKTPKQLKEDYEWLGEVPYVTLAQKKRDFDSFSKQLFYKNRKKQLGRPSFKSKDSRQSCRFDNSKFKMLETRIQLSKIGKVKAVIDRKVPKDAKLLSVTVSRNKDGKYFASVSFETQQVYLPATGKTVGVDLGLKSFAVLSDGTEIDNPKYLRENQPKIIKVQKYLSRKEKGSRRRGKLKLRLARLYTRVTNARSNFLHNVTTKLVKENDTIVIEDLNISGMMKNHCLAGSIQDASWSMFRNMLSYKCSWYGRELVIADRFFASTKTCSSCGSKQVMSLKDRTYCCSACGLEIDRDLNAALNLKALAVSNAIRTSRGKVTSPAETFRSS